MIRVGHIWCGSSFFFFEKSASEKGSKIKICEINQKREREENCRNIGWKKWAPLPELEPGGEVSGVAAATATS